MTKKSLIFALAAMAVVLGPAPCFSSQRPTCSDQTEPADQLVCNDPTLAGLDHEVALLDTGLSVDNSDMAKDRRAVAQRLWRRRQASICQMPASGRIGFSDALRARSCLVQFYEDRIRKTIKGPRIDCARTTEPTELLVCSDFELRLLDGGLNAVYSAVAKEGTQTEQRKKEWLDKRANRCGIPPLGDIDLRPALLMRTCLLDIYKAEILAMTGDGTAAGDQKEDLSIGLKSQDQASKLASDRMMSCFQKARGFISIQGMHDCSGYWVTPLIFTSCVSGSKCIQIRDDLAEIETFNEYLKNEAISRSSSLQIEAKIAASSIDPQILENCKTTSGTGAGFVGCALLPGSLQHFQAISQCVGQVSDQAASARCIASSVNNASLNKIVNCVSSPHPAASEVLGCLQDSNAAGAAQKIVSCIESGGGAEKKKQCVIDALPADQLVAARCLLVEHKAACLSAQFPDVARAKHAIECLTTEKENAAGCLALQGIGLGGDVGSCVALDNRDASVDCLLAKNPSLQTAYTAWSCVSRAETSTEQATSCTLGLIPGLDSRTRQAVTCVAGSEGDETKLANCAAAAVLPPEVARIVSCGATSTGVTSFAICGAAPFVNEEWRITAECAVESGGFPVAWAGCTAGQLTIRELLKCTQGRIGEEGGCFGPNNTIVKFFSNAFKDITEGPGPNNEIVKAVKAIGDGLVAAAAGVQHLENEIRKHTEVRIDEGTVHNVCKNLTFGIGSC